jgi:DNA/RNA-binding domain of Phe-tRNA-synthetase-like protein
MERKGRKFHDGEERKERKERKDKKEKERISGRKVGNDGIVAISHKRAASSQAQYIVSADSKLPCRRSTFRFSASSETVTANSTKRVRAMVESLRGKRLADRSACR